jgi:hypothetical protein
MKNLIFTLFACLIICSCNKKNNDPMPTKPSTLYFLEYEVPENTTVTSYLDNDTVVDAPQSGPAFSFTTIDKNRTIKYSCDNPINIRVRARDLNNYQSGHIYIEILNTTSGTLDLSSLPE